jgi:ribonuclease Z
MKRVAIVLGAVAAVLLGAVALVWFVPQVQDRIVQRAMTRQIGKAARAPYLTDDALHILLCGTGSPMPDMTRANACAAVIAGGRVVVIDSGPGAWARLAGANIPGAKIDTVLLTHLHSDHIGDLGEVATQSWLGGRKVPLDVWAAGAASLRAHHRRGGRDLRRGRHRGGGEGLRASLQLGRRVPHRPRPRPRADRSRAHDRP